MKTLPIAALVVFLYCLETALSNPNFAPEPRAKFQEKVPLGMAGRPRGISRESVGDADAQEGVCFHDFYTHVRYTMLTLQTRCLAMMGETVRGPTRGRL